MKTAIFRLTDACIGIANEATSTTGYVTIRDLCVLCNCHIISRPLLVEAAITRPISNPNEWTVLLNSSIHPISDEAFEYESHLSPLPPRTRNTAAHEVAHAIAVEKLGIDFTDDGDQETKIRQIERAIEVASPLLLVSSNFFFRFFNDHSPPRDSVIKVAEFAKHNSISREILLKSMVIFKRRFPTDFINLDSLLEATWGVGEWKGKKGISLKSSWILSNNLKSYNHPLVAAIVSHRSLSVKVTDIREVGNSLEIDIRYNEIQSSCFTATIIAESSNSKKPGKFFYRINSVLPY